MPLIINKVSSCSTQVSYTYLESDLLFGYTRVGTYKVDFADISFTDESDTLSTGIEALREAYERPNLTARIGADEFTNGRFTGASFEQSFLAGDSSCTITIEQLDKLDDYDSNLFAEFIPHPEWISSFQENFSFSRSGDNYTSTRSTSITYKQFAGNTFLNDAKSFLSNTYADNRPALGYHVDGISENGRFNESFRPLITETIDLLNLTVSLQETLQTSFIDGDISKRQTISREISEEGYTTTKYSVEIKALKEPLEGVALAACGEILDVILTSHAESPTEIAKGINRDGGNITLNVTFSNDPRLKDESISYTVTRSKSDSEFYEYSITMEVSVVGKNKETRIEDTKTAWAAIAGTYEAKINSLFTASGTLYEKSRTYNFSSREPKITDTVVYTQDPSFENDPEILKDEISITTDFALKRQRLFISPATRGEIVEVLEDLPSIGNYSITRNITVKMSVGMRGLIILLEDWEPSVADVSDVINASFEGVGSRVITSAITEFQ